MSTMNISIPDDLRAWAESQVQTRAYMSMSEFVRDLMRRQKDIDQLTALMDEGLASPDAGPVEADFIAELRAIADK